MKGAGLLITILIVTLLVLPTSMALSPVNYVEGDLNGDNLVDVRDLIMVIKALRHNDNSRDMDGNNVMDVRDLIASIRHIQKFKRARRVNIVCGDGVRAHNEACDGRDLGGKTCEDFNMMSGTLQCTSCRFDTSSCMEIQAPCPMPSCVAPDPGCRYEYTDELNADGCPLYPCGKMICDPFEDPNACTTDSDCAMKTMCPQVIGGDTPKCVNNVCTCGPGNMDFICPTPLCVAPPVGCKVETTNEVNSYGCPIHPCGKIICEGNTDLFVTLSPRESVVSYNEKAFVDIMATTNQKLVGIQLEIEYDPTVLKLSEIIEGPFISKGGSVPTLLDANTASAGLIHNMVIVMIEKDTYVTGEGQFATLEFDAIGTGTSEITVKKVLSSKPDATPIESSAMGTRVSVQMFTDECGSGVKSQAEACDGSDLGGWTCEDFGFHGGSLSCSNICNFDTSGCVDPLKLYVGDINSDGKVDMDDAGEILLYLEDRPLTHSITAQNADVTLDGRINGEDGKLISNCAINAAECNVKQSEYWSRVRKPAIECGDGIRDAGENCDMRDLGGLTCRDFGFPSGSLSCTNACEIDTSACAQCGNGRRDSGESCDGSNLGGLTCSNFGFDTGNLRCNSNCAFDTNNCYNNPPATRCGDGIVSGDESCDGSNLNGKSCRSYDYDRGTLRCTNVCRFDMTNCANDPPTQQSVCGNGILESGEICDGSKFDGLTCRNFNYDKGSLRCTNNCQTISKTNCANDPPPPPDSVCGNGVLEVGEVCDGSKFDGLTCRDFDYDKGSLRCTNNCQTISKTNCANDPPPAEPFCGDGNIDFGEACDGNNFGGKTCQDYNFDSGSLTCTSSCYLSSANCVRDPVPDPEPEPNEPVCGNNIIEAGEMCDSNQLNGRSCSDKGFNEGKVRCTSTCRISYDNCYNVANLCGNQKIDAGEQCDGPVSVTCNDAGYATGLVKCTDCEYDYSSCSGSATVNTCGDGAKAETEQCDGTDFGGKNKCSDYGYTDGHVRCTSTCRVDRSSCSTCGNNKVESGEICDGTNFGGKTCQTYGWSSGELSCRYCETILQTNCRSSTKYPTME